MSISSARYKNGKCTLLNYNTYEETSKQWIGL